MALLQRQSGSQPRGENVLGAENKCWGKVLLARARPSGLKSPVPVWRLEEEESNKQTVTNMPVMVPINLQPRPAVPGKPLTRQRIKGRFQCLLNRVATFVAMKCRSAASGDLLCRCSVFIISYKIQSDVKITGPVTLTRLNLMGCPLSMNGPVNNLCVLSLLCGFS